MATEPTINKINYTPISEKDLKKQVEGQLKPQYDQALKQLKQQSKVNASQINSDALARGIARGSYVGRMLDYNQRQTDQSQNDLSQNYNSNFNAALGQLRQNQQDREFNYLQYNNSLDQWLAQYRANQESEAWNRQFQQDQFNWQKQQAAQSASRSSSGSGGSSGGLTAADIIAALRAGNAGNGASGDGHLTAEEIIEKYNKLNGNKNSTTSPYGINPLKKGYTA